MKKWFKKEEVQYSQNENVDTPYQRAKQEWDDRIGSARVQAKNWRFMAILSMAVALLALIMLAISVSISQNNVFVAQVTQEGRVVNVTPMQTPYKPTVAQEEYFIKHFVELTRNLPLDPVVAKQNWMEAYHFLTQRSSEQLNQYLQTANPMSLLGKETITTDITDINPVSDNIYQVDWIEVTTGTDGKVQGQSNFSGVFTVIVKQPTTQENIFENPLGIYITDFNISSREK